MDPSSLFSPVTVFHAGRERESRLFQQIHWTLMCFMQAIPHCLHTVFAFISDHLFDLYNHLLSVGAYQEADFATP
jgi:hypothetical protein